jgi:hypothetical protein
VSKGRYNEIRTDDIEDESTAKKSTAVAGSANFIVAAGFHFPDV